MGVLIDKNILIQSERSESLKLLTTTLKDQIPYISVITVSELWHGVERAANDRIHKKRTEWVRGILQVVNVIKIDANIAKVHAKLWANLVKTGQLIGAHDLWIAATCLALDLQLYSVDYKDFKKVTGIKFI